MADVEGKNREFEQLDLPGEELVGPLLHKDKKPLLESAASDDEEMAALADLAAESPADEDQQAESQEDETEEEETQEEETEEKGGFLESLSKANPYTVMLGVALAAILIAVTCLFLEWNTYELDISASDYSQRAK